MLDSDIRVNKKYYTQTLLEEWEYQRKRNKMENLINDELDLSSSDNKSDNEMIMKVILSLIVTLMSNLVRIKEVF